MSTPTESKLYDKEYKLPEAVWKRSAVENRGWTEKVKEKDKERKTTPEMDNFLNFFEQLTRTYYPMLPLLRHMMGYPATRQIMGLQRGVCRDLLNYINTSSAGCWKCGDPSNYQASCDKK